MKVGEIWSLKVEDKHGINPLVVILDASSDNFTCAPLFWGDENATHKDRMIYPVQSWLNHEDWVALQYKVDLQDGCFKSLIGTLPQDIFEKIISAANGEGSTLPKGILMIEGIGDKREELREEMVCLLQKISDQKFEEIIIKKIKSGWEAINAKLEESFADIALMGATSYRGNKNSDEKDRFTSLKIKSKNIDVVVTLKRTDEKLRIMNINGKFSNVRAKTDDAYVTFKRICGIWIPERALFFEETDEVIIDNTTIRIMT
jgi:hypothetical protein